MNKHELSKNKTVGHDGEIFTKNYLMNQGLKFKKSNYYSRYGEVDIIFEDDKYIIFVEVKTRKKSSMIRGVESVDKNKRIKIIKTAMVYLSEYQSDKQPRFDVSEVITNNIGFPENINYYKNAFGMDERFEIF